MLRRTLRRARLWLARDHVTRDGVVLPARHLRFCGPTFHDDAHFLASARREARRLVTRCGLTATSRVLDVGCGPGRLAIGLLAEGHAVAQYRGLDVHEPSVVWCRRHLARANPAFHFAHVDVRNARYNPAGTERAGRVRLAADDASHDVVYLYSVFSHMPEDDVRGYLREIARVLAPGGTLFCTAFVEEAVPPVSENPSGYRLPWAGPLHCVRYERGHLDALFREAGLRVVDFEHGTETDGQSAIYARRA